MIVQVTVKKNSKKKSKKKKKHYGNLLEKNTKTP
jgi:hypothetical protein